MSEQQRGRADHAGDSSGQRHLVPTGKRSHLRSRLPAPQGFSRTTPACISPGYYPHHRAQRAGHSGRVAGEGFEGSAGRLMAHQSARICGPAFRVVVAHASPEPAAGNWKKNRRRHAAGVRSFLPAGGGSVRAEYRLMPSAGTIYRPPLRADASRRRHDRFLAGISRSQWDGQRFRARVLRTAFD